MDEQKRREELLTTVINLFAGEFGDKLILRGGMVLRLLDSPRMTNDIDLLFVPYKSKNDIVDQTVGALRSLDDVTVEYSLNSKCLRCIVKQKDLVVQVEAKVAKVCKTEVISTASLSKLYNQTPRVINVMAFDVAMSHKLAAWYERRLARDLYDIYLYITMGVTPDEEVLASRLEKVSLARGVKKIIKEEKMSLQLFFSFLKQEVSLLTEERLIGELEAILPENELLKLDMKIKRAIIDKL